MKWKYYSDVWEAWYSHQLAIKFVSLATLDQPPHLTVLYQTELTSLDANASWGGKNPAKEGVWSYREWTEYLTQAGLCRRNVLTAPTLAVPLLWKVGPELSLPAVLKHNAAKQQGLELIFIDSAPFHHRISVFRPHVKYGFDITYTSLWLIGSTKQKSRRSQHDIRFSLIFLRSWENAVEEKAT